MAREALALAEQVRAGGYAGPTPEEIENRAAEARAQRRLRRRQAQGQD